MKYLRIVIAGVTICAGEQGGRFVKGLLCLALAAVSLLFWPAVAQAQGWQSRGRFAKRQE